MSNRERDEQEQQERERQQQEQQERERNSMPFGQQVGEDETSTTPVIINR